MARTFLVSRSLFRHDRSGLAEVELVGEARAEDVVLQIDVQVGRRSEGRRSGQDQPVADAGRERRIARDLEIFTPASCLPVQRFSRLISPGRVEGGKLTQRHRNGVAQQCGLSGRVAVPRDGRAI